MQLNKRQSRHVIGGVLVRYRKLDSKGDMQGQRGNDNYHLNEQAVAAAIRSRILSFRGEWWENPDDGIPFNILTGKMNAERQQIADAYLKERIAQTQGVAQLVSYHSEFGSKERQINVEVLTEYGGTVALGVSI